MILLAEKKHAPDYDKYRGDCRSNHRLSTAQGH